MHYYGMSVIYLITVSCKAARASDGLQQILHSCKVSSSLCKFSSSRCLPKSSPSTFLYITVLTLENCLSFAFETTFIKAFKGVTLSTEPFSLGFCSDLRGEVFSFGFCLDLSGESFCLGFCSEFDLSGLLELSYRSLFLE
jgi:hypothetical protein